MFYSIHTCTNDRLVILDLRKKPSDLADDSSGITSRESFLFISRLFLAINTRKLVKFYDNDENISKKKCLFSFKILFPVNKIKYLWKY